MAPAHSVPAVSMMSSLMIATLPFTSPMMLVDLGLVVRRPLLREQREVGAEHLGELLGQLRPAGVGGDDDQLLARQPLVAEVLGELRQRRHVVDGDVEEALHLAGVQVHREHPVGARDLQQVGHQARGDRLARRALLVLARVRVPGDDHRDPLGRGQLGALHHDQELHQVPVDRRGAGLHQEHVGAADRLVVADVDLAVREGLQPDPAELQPELVGDLLGQIGVRATGEQHHPARVLALVRRRQLGLG